MSTQQFDELAKNMGVDVTAGNIDKGNFDDSSGNELDQATECELVAPIEGESEPKVTDEFTQNTGLANSMSARTVATLVFSCVLLGGGYLGWQQFFPSSSVAKDPQKTEKTADNPADTTVASSNTNPGDGAQNDSITPPTTPPSTDPNSPTPVDTGASTATTASTTATGTNSATGAVNTGASTPTTPTSPLIVNSPKNPSTSASGSDKNRSTPSPVITASNPVGNSSKNTSPTQVTAKNIPGTVSASGSDKNRSTPSPVITASNPVGNNSKNTSPTQVTAKNIPGTFSASGSDKNRSTPSPVITASNPVGNNSKTPVQQKSAASISSDSANKPNTKPAAPSPVVTAFASQPVRPQPSAFSTSSSSSKTSKNADSVATLPPSSIPQQQSRDRDLPPTATVGDSEVYGTAKAIPGSVDQTTVAALPPPPPNPSNSDPAPPKSEEAPPLSDYLTAQLPPTIASNSQVDSPPPAIAPAPLVIENSSQPSAKESTPSTPLIENGLPQSETIPTSTAKLDTSNVQPPKGEKDDGEIIVPFPSPETRSPLPDHPPQSRILMASANIDQPPSIFLSPGSDWTLRDFGSIEQANKSLEKEPKADTSNVIDESQTRNIPDLKLP